MYKRAFAPIALLLLAVPAGTAAQSAVPASEPAVAPEPSKLLDRVLVNQKKEEAQRSHRCHAQRVSFHLCRSRAARRSPACQIRDETQSGIQTHLAAHFHLPQGARICLDRRGIWRARAHRRGCYRGHFHCAVSWKDLQGQPLHAGTLRSAARTLATDVFAVRFRRPQIVFRIFPPRTHAVFELSLHWSAQGSYRSHSQGTGACRVEQDELHGRRSLRLSPLHFLERVSSSLLG